MPEALASFGGMNCFTHNGEMKKDYGTMVAKNHRITGVQLLGEAHSRSLAIFPFVSCCVMQKQPCNIEVCGEVQGLEEVPPHTKTMTQSKANTPWTGLLCGG